MNQKTTKYNFLILTQVLAFGLILVFSPCSVRNTIQDSLQVEKTAVTNKSVSLHSAAETCLTSLSDIENDQLAQLVHKSTPNYTAISYTHSSELSYCFSSVEDLAVRHYQPPFQVKDKTPLYLLHQQFKSYLIVA